MNPRIIWVLTKKNLLETFTIGWFLPALAFLVSVIDIWFPLPAEAWSAIAIFMVLYLAPTAAVSSFFGDVRKESHRFLDYLPIRPGERWASRIIDAAAAVALMFVLLFWNRAISIFLSPVSLAEFGFPQTSRILWSLVALVLWQLACGAFLGFAVTSNVMLVMGLSFLPTALLLGAITWIVVTHQVVPLTTDLVPVLLLSAGAFLASSYVLYAVFPRHWSRMRRWLVGGLPLIVFIVGISSMALAQSVEEWKRWDAKDGLVFIRNASVVPGSETTPPGILVTAFALRSGFHQFSMDLEGKQLNRLGRGLVELPHLNSRLLHFQETHPYMLPSTRSRFVTMERDGSSRTAFPLGPGDKQEPLVSNISVSENGEFVWWTDYSTEFGKYRIIVSDRSGRRIWESPLADVASGAFAKDSRLVVHLSDEPEEVDSSDPPQETTLLLLNCTTADQTTVTLPGQLLHLAGDLSRAVCIRHRIAGQRLLSSLVGVEIPSMVELNLAGEDELTSSSMDDVSFYSSGNLMSAEDGFGIANNYAIHAPTMMFDETMSRALWVRSFTSDTRITQSLVLINLADGSRTPLLSEDELPAIDRSPRSSVKTPVFQLHGFAGDGEQAVYSIDKDMYLLDLVHGRTSVPLAPAPPEEHDATTTASLPAKHSAERRSRASADTGNHRVTQDLLSPSRRRVMRITSLVPDFQDSEKPGIKALLETMKPKGAVAVSIFEHGVEKRVFTGTEDFDCKWIDEDNILANNSRRVLVIKADGSGHRQVFPATAPRGSGGAN